MAGDDRKGHRFQVPFDNVQVRATGRAAVDPDQHLARTRFRVGQLLELERCGVDRRIFPEDSGSHAKTIGTPSPHESIRIRCTTNGAHQRSQSETILVYHARAELPRWLFTRWAFHP